MLIGRVNVFTQKLQSQVKYSSESDYINLTNDISRSHVYRLDHVQIGA